MRFTRPLSVPIEGEARPTYLRHAGPTSVKLPQIGWERTAITASGIPRIGPIKCAGTRRHTQP